MPYIFTFPNIAFDYLMAFCLGVLFAVTINAEAQAFMAQILGDVRSADNSRFHFNAFRHLDIAGTVAFFVAGFGWPRHVDMDANKFEHPRLYSIIARLAGPVANFLLAGIISSVSLIIEQFNIDPLMLEIVLGVNLMVAVSNILPFPPLALGRMLEVLYPGHFRRFSKRQLRWGPYLLTTLLIAERLSRSGIIHGLLLPLYNPVFRFLTKSYAFG